MSVTFAAHKPVMAQAQFGQKQQAKAHVTQFSSNNPADGSKAGATGPKFGLAICSTLCCAGGSIVAIPLAIVTAIGAGIFFLFKGLIRGGK